MAFNIDITPDDEKMLNAILDKGIDDLKYTNTLRNEDSTSNRQLSDNNNKLSNNSNNFSRINTHSLVNNIQESKPKSSALRALLDEIKSDHSSPSSSKSPKRTQNIVSNNVLEESNTIYESNIKAKGEPQLHKRNVSTSSLGSKDLNFKDMKSEISSIQEKIDGLEKKLFSSSTNKNQYQLNNLERKASEDVQLQNKVQNSVKGPSTNDLMEKTREIMKKAQYKPINTTQRVGHSPVNKLISKSFKEVNHSLDSHKFNQISTRRHRKKDTSSLNSSSDKRSVGSQRSLNSSKNLIERDNYVGSKTSSNSYFKSAMNEWKEKYLKLQKDNDVLRSTVIQNKKRLMEYEKKIRSYDKKVNSFEELNMKFNKIIEDHESLINQYEQSELIRREQAKLIKSLQNEVEVLRKYTTMTEENQTFKTEEKSKVYSPVDRGEEHDLEKNKKAKRKKKSSSRTKKIEATKVNNSKK